jgi:kynurenine formamidase
VALERDETGIFWAACFPLKIKGASAGLTRAVAILPDDGAD